MSFRECSAHRVQMVLVTTESGLVVYQCPVAECPKMRSVKGGPKCRKKGKSFASSVGSKEFAPDAHASQRKRAGRSVHVAQLTQSTPPSRSEEQSLESPKTETQAELWNEYAEGVMKRNPIHRDDN